jgi:hypothetical protein
MFCLLYIGSKPSFIIGRGWGPFKVVKSERLKRTAYAARVEKQEMHPEVLYEKLMNAGHFENGAADGKIVLKLINLAY